MFNLLALAIFIAVCALIRFDGLLNFSTHFIGGATHDAGLYIWLMQEAFPSLIRQGDPWFSTSAFYPYANTLSWSDNFILPSLIAYPFIKNGVSLQVVFNSLMLAAVTLNGYCTYLLSKYLTGDTTASIFAGVLFMTFPFLQEHAGHPQLQFAFFLPLGILFSLKFFRELKLKDLILLMIIFFSCFLTTVYYAVFIAYSFFVFLILFFVKEKFESVNKLCRFDFFLSGAVFLFVFLPFAFPYFETAKLFGERKLYEAYYFSADIFSYFSSVSNNLIYGFTSKLSHSEAHLFNGLIPLALMLVLIHINGRKYLMLAVIFAAALIAVDFIPRPFSLYLTSLIMWGLLIYCCRQFIKGSKSPLGFISMLLIITFAVSFGPLGNPEKGDLPTSPFLAAYYAVPGFKSVRAISRIGILVELLSAVICAYSISAIFNKLKYKTADFSGRKYAAAFAVLCLPTLVENYTKSFPLGELPAKPEILSMIPNDSSRVIILPLVSEPLKNGEVRSWSDFALQNVNAMNWMVNSGHKIVNGYSGLRSARMKDLPRRLKGFPDQRSIEVLSKSVPVKYVVLLGTKDLQEYDRQRLVLLNQDSAGNRLFEVKGG